MKHQFKQRIIYQDTDAEGVVYYANYLGYFERGRMEYLRKLGVSMKELKEKYGLAFAIARVECDYKAPALLDDEITVETEVAESAAATIIFKQQVLREDKILVSARITACAISLKSFRPMKIPKELADKMQVS